MAKRLIHPDERAEGFIVHLIAMLFGDVAALSESVVYENICLGCKGGWSEENRRISKKIAYYAAENFGYIYLGLISSDPFRASFKDSISIEIQIDKDRDPEFEASIRQKLAENEEQTHDEDEESFIIDLSVYDQTVADDIAQRLNEALKRIAPYEDEFNDLVDELDKMEKIEIGFFVSNFMYLLKALDKNPSFLNYIKRVVASVKETLHVE